MASKNNNKHTHKSILLKHFIPIAIIIALMTTAYFLGINDYVNFDILKEKRDITKYFITNHPILSPLIYIIIYIVATAISLPGAAILSIIGGILFPQPWSTIYIVISASTGATLLYLAAKTALKTFFEKKAGKILIKMKKGFDENAISYMLFLRLVPLFPFWLVNIAPSILQVRLRIFYWTTLIGIIPGSFVFAQTGAGIDVFLAKADDFSMTDVLNWKMKIALISLGFLALIPIIIKKIKKRKQEKKSG